MDGFLKTAACVLITLVLYITIDKKAKDIAVVIGVAACIMIAIATVTYIQPVFSFFNQLQSIGKLDPESMSILLRCVGIGILAEIISLICTDAGNAALGKMTQFAAGLVVLWLSLPLFKKLIELIEGILLLA